MWKYVLRRILGLIPVLIGVSIFVFLLLHMTPGDPALLMLGERAPEEQIENLREKMGLNDPLPVQYIGWLSRVVRLDLGRSLRSGKQVILELKERLPNTAILTVLAIFLSSAIGIPIGVLSAVKPNSFFDNIFTGLTFTAVGIPIFWQGIMLILIFSVFLGWLPSSGMELDIRHFILPTIALSTVSTANITRITRSTMLDILKEDYVRTAKAKGLKDKIVVYKHALRNALIPVVTIIGLRFGRLLAGAVLTETIFAWPGMGRMLVDAIRTNDFPLVQGSILIFALLFALVNLLVDVLYAYLDPRLQTKFE